MTAAQCHSAASPNCYSVGSACSTSRVKGGVVMVDEALAWVKSAYPYWNRRGGADHIWFFGHDEGACWAPQEIYSSSIILTHWGRLGETNPGSSTARFDYDYTQDKKDDPKLPQGFRALIGRHGCFTPGKDLVLPAFRAPLQYSLSPYLGGDFRQRDIFVLLRGQMGFGKPLGPATTGWNMRQHLYSLSQQRVWRKTYNIWIGSHKELKGDYSLLLARSLFCLVIPGDGWDPLFEDAMLHGCIPVYFTGIIDVEGPFASIFKWSTLTIQVPWRDIERLPQILESIPHEQVMRMRRRIAKVWHRFAWLAHPVIRYYADQMMANNKQKYPWIFEAPATKAAAAAATGRDKDASEDEVPALAPLPAPLGGSLFDRSLNIPGEAINPTALASGRVQGLQRLSEEDVQDDAFNTLLQWLYHKIPEARRQQMPQPPAPPPFDWSQIPADPPSRPHGRGRGNRRGGRNRRGNRRQNRRQGGGGDATADDVLPEDFIDSA